MTSTCTVCPRKQIAEYGSLQYVNQSSILPSITQLIHINVQRKHIGQLKDKVPEILYVNGPNGDYLPDLLEFAAVDLYVVELVADSAHHLVAVTRGDADVLVVRRRPLGDELLALAVYQSYRRRCHLLVYINNLTLSFGKWHKSCW